LILNSVRLPHDDPPRRAMFVAGLFQPFYACAKQRSQTVQGRCYSIDSQPHPRAREEHPAAGSFGRPGLAVRRQLGLYEVARQLLGYAIRLEESPDESESVSAIRRERRGLRHPLLSRERPGPEALAVDFDSRLAGLGI